MGIGIHRADEAGRVWSLSRKRRVFTQSRRVSREPYQRHSVTYWCPVGMVEFHYERDGHSRTSSQMGSVCGLIHARPPTSATSSTRWHLLPSFRLLPYRSNSRINRTTSRRFPMRHHFRRPVYQFNPLRSWDITLPAIVIAYLMRKYRLGLGEILEFVQSKQKVKPSSNFTRQLQIWEVVDYQVWEDEERTVAKAPYKLFLSDRANLLKKKELTGNELLAPQNL